MRPAYSPAAEQGQAGAQFKLGVMSTTAEPQHLVFRRDLYGPIKHKM